MFPCIPYTHGILFPSFLLSSYLFFIWTICFCSFVSHSLQCFGLTWFILVSHFYLPVAIISSFLATLLWFVCFCFVYCGCSRTRMQKFSVGASLVAQQVKLLSATPSLDEKFGSFRLVFTLRRICSLV